MKDRSIKTGLFVSLSLLIGVMFPRNVSANIKMMVAGNDVNPVIQLLILHRFKIVITILFLLVSFVLVYVIRYKKNQKRKAVDSQSKDSNDAYDIISADEIRWEDGTDYNCEVIVRFFLKIFKIQCGGTKSSPGKYHYIDSVSVWPNKVYELSVRHNDEWINRRFTIGPLGEDGVSKSLCFYAIYDDHLVIKVPVDPIKDFDDYLDFIKADMMIAKRVYPKECIIPKVSVILDRVIKRDDSEHKELEEKEQFFIKRLRSDTYLQDYLKIGKSFVFFMDLSKYYFLSNVVKEMHDMENLMQHEIMKNPEINWDTTAFEGRYGKENTHICYEVRDLYNKYEGDIDNLLSRSNAPSTFPRYQMKTWFLIHLSGRGEIKSEGKFPDKFAAHLNSASRKAIGRNDKLAKSYRLLIKDYLFKQTVAKYRVEMSSIVTNIISLLVWLGKQKVAIRDLKPDNLLIAGAPEHYPIFLRTIDAYSIGLIDLETAVDYSSEDPFDIEQPQLGGTPNYATPSHLFPNELLLGVYEDIQHVLHLQDWHACLTMIFRIVTGQNLYEKTAMLLPEIKRIMESPMKDSEHLLYSTEYVSRLFWSKARDEFEEKVADKNDILTMVKVIVLEKDKEILLKLMNSEVKLLSVVMLQMINEQTFFKSKANREKIYSASTETIEAMRAKCEKGIKHEIDKAAVLRFFVELEIIKKQFKQRNEIINYVKNTTDRISVAVILKMMFNMVFSGMYTEAWGALSEKVKEEIEYRSEASYDATI